MEGVAGRLRFHAHRHAVADCDHSVHITTATLTFYLHIDTAETGSTAYDKLTVQLKNSSGTVLTTLATYSNVNAASGYSLKSFNVAAYKGQAVTLVLTGAEDSSLQTSFVVDDFALNTQ